MSFDLDPSDFLAKMKSIDEGAEKNALTGVQDTTDELERISTNIAPIRKSGLRKSTSKKVDIQTGRIVGTVTFSITEKSGKGRFNYALWTHEESYTLGERSAGSPGTDGYAVGNKYLERPLKGEMERFIKWWGETILKGMD